MVSSTSSNGATDNELMVAVGRGDRRALGVLFERHYEQVRLICYRMTGEAEAADDLAQDSFVRVLRYAKGFERRAAFTTWLYRLVRNVCLDHIAGEARRQARAEQVASEPRHRAHPPEETDPRLATLREALHSLPPEKREVLVLSRYQGLSYADIAEVCETTVGAIKVRAHRAMRELRRRFDELEKAT